MVSSEGFSIKDSFITYFIPIILAAVFLRLLRNKFRPRLWKIPGPPVAAYIALWRLYDVRQGLAEKTAVELHWKYGPLVGIGPDHVSVGNAREISNIYGLKTGYTKATVYPIQCIS